MIASLQSRTPFNAFIGLLLSKSPVETGKSLKTQRSWFKCSLELCNRDSQSISILLWDSLAQSAAQLALGDILLIHGTCHLANVHSIKSY